MDRLEKLEKRIAAYKSAQRPTVFLLEDGSVFETLLDPFEYLLQHDVETPRGRIAAYPHPTEGIDDLSLSLYAEIDKMVKAGGGKAFRAVIDKLNEKE